MMRNLLFNVFKVSIVFQAIFLLSLGGCLNKEVYKPNPFFEKWQEKAETAQPYLPQKKSFDDSASQENGSDIKKIAPESSQSSRSTTLFENLSSKKISVRFVGDSLSSVLRTMARLANENILISPNVKGTLDTHIENTPWNTVFMGIIDSYGLVVTKEENLLHVMSYTDMEQQLKRKSLQLEEDQIAPLVTKLVAIEYSTPSEVAASLLLLLSKDNKGQNRGSVSVDAHSRSVIIRESQENMNNLLQLVSELDLPTPQILIKAHIIETSKDTARELGIQWGATTGQNGDFLYKSSGDFSSGGATLGLIAKGSSLTLEMQLTALQEDGKINILSSPSIATLDNNQAIIESGTSIPYPTGIDTNGNSSYSVQEATLKLTVTPHVISDTMIKLDINAQKDEIDSTRDLGGTPFLLKKNANTKLIVQNNATVVIAGLTKETTSNRNNGVPFFKDVPLLGYLFKNDINSNKFEDLLIFITPTILNQAQ